ncbi:MAG TPA: RHS repeat-associated core domain-containing protein [Thermoanaerobaculia bacterium]
MIRWAILALVLGLACAAPAAAEVHPNTAPGFPVEQSFHVGEIDNVNLFNGGLTLTLPIGGSYPVNGGLSYGLKLVYNANPWTFSTITIVQPNGTETKNPIADATACSNAGLGWRVSLGEFQPPCQQPDGMEQLSPHIYQDENGTDHLFYPTLHEGDPEDAPLAGVSQILYTRDGSYLRLKVLSNGGRKLEFPDGTVRTFDTEGRLTEIRDPFNNVVTVAYLLEDGNPSFLRETTAQWVISDSHNRVQRVFFTFGVPDYPDWGLPIVDRIELASLNNGTAIYQFGYESRTIGRACPSNDEFLKTTRVPLLTSVTLPDGSAWKTSADTGYVTALPAGTARCTDHAANLTSWTLPTLGRLEWTWQTWRFPQISQKNFLNRNSGVASRTMRNPDGVVIGTWSYAQAPEPGQTYNDSREVSTTVTDPLLHKTVHYFSVAQDANESATGWSLGDYSLPFTRRLPLTAGGATLNLSRQVFTAGSPNNAVRSEYVLYERELFGPSAGTTIAGTADNANRNRRMVRSRTVYDDDGSTFAGVISSDFDGLGHYRRQETEGNFPGSNTRVQFGNYNPARGTYTINPVTGAGSGYNLHPAGSAWVLETMTQMWEQEAGTTAYTDLCYAANSATVNRKRIRRQEAQGNKDLITIYGLQNGNVTSESFYGGDAQTVSSGDLCTLTLPAAPEYQINHTWLYGVRKTSQYSGTGHFLLDNTLDFNTGLVTSSADSAGLVTNYEYDALGRMTWSKPPSTHGGWTQFVYTPANPAGSQRASVTVRRRGNGSKSAPILAVDLLVFDYFGRVYQEQKQLPGSLFTKRETLYDQAGNKASVSEWTTGNPTDKTTFSGYDPFGRPGTITAADGQSVLLTYSGTRQVQRKVHIATGQGAVSQATATEIYDRHGRLHSVTEPSGAGGADVTTTYGYDVGNRLSSVFTPASVGGVNVQQTRSFTYDRAGLLLSETHPEKGAAGNGAVSYPGYDSRGHVLRKTDGPNDLTFSYDKAERLLQVQEVSTGRLLKSFTYATANGGAADWSQGKLRQASRYNYVTLGGAPYTLQIAETYTYGGVDGRVSRRDTAAYVNGSTSPSESFTQSFAYNALGLTSSLDYPRCTHAGCVQPAEFVDVPAGHPDRIEIEAIHPQVTTGCGGPYYCPDGAVTRGQMSVFLLSAKEGPGYTPPACVTPMFMDVPCSSSFAPWINEMARRGITGGCGGGNYCPENPVTNEQMAVFLIATLGISPSPCTVAPFTDVPCASVYAAFIAEEARRQIARECEAGKFCPTGVVTRAKMAGLLTRAFDIPVAADPATARTIPFTYSSGLLTSVGSGGAYGTLSYHPNLLVSQVTHGNGVTETQGNDPAGIRRPSSLGASGPYASWSSGTYSYDGAGNIKAIGAAWFAYDKVSRLVSATLYDGPTGGGNQRQQSYTFDPFGNLTNIAGSPGRSIPTSAQTNRLNSPGSSYDAAGNLKTWNGAVYEYDRFNQMSRMTSGGEDWIYLYTADDERIWSYKADGTFSRWTIRDLGGKVLREYQNKAGVWSLGTDYIYRDGSLLAAETPTGRRHFHLDHLGTPRLITRGSGHQAAYHVYYPFGEELTAFNQDAERMKFTGHERDLNSPAGAGDDLDYMHARHCSPVTGRFLSVDPVLGRPKHPQSWNRYSYVIGSPLKYIDPDGRSIWSTVFKIIRHAPDGTRRVITTVRELSKRKAVEKTKRALDKIDNRQRSQGVKRVVRAETDKAQDAMAKQLSTNKKSRGPEKSGGKDNPRYPMHSNPDKGPYEDVHVESDQSVLSVTAVAATLGEIFAPATSGVSESEEATPSELASAAAWDITSALDPIGITDAINWYFDID